MNQALPIRAGVFENEPAADRAVVDLLAAGFSKDKISVVSSHPIAHHAEHPDVTTVAPSGSHTRRAALVGGAVGSALGVLAAFLAGSGTGWTWLMIAAALIGASVIGSLVGGFIGAMMSRGFEPEIADFHDQAMKPDQYLVAVEVAPTEARLDSADAVLENAGATTLPMAKR